MKSKLTNEPDKDYISKASNVLESVNDLISQAIPFLLNNYSYEDFKNLGVAEEILLKEETPEAMQRVATLESVMFDEARCKEFELSFPVPWDEEHSFSVIFENAKAVSCTVDG